MDKTFLRALVDEVFVVLETVAGGNLWLKFGLHAVHHVALLAVDEFAEHIPNIEALKLLPGATLSREGLEAEVNAVLDLVKSHFGGGQVVGGVIESVRTFFMVSSGLIYARLIHRGALSAPPG